MNREKIINTIAEIKIRLDRGNMMLYWTRSIILMLAGIKILLPVTNWELVILSVVALFALYFLGWFDLNKIMLLQKEAELMAGKYNPFFNRMDKKIDNKKV